MRRLFEGGAYSSKYGIMLYLFIIIISVMLNEWTLKLQFPE